MVTVTVTVVVVVVVEEEECVPGTLRGNILEMVV